MNCEIFSFRHLIQEFLEPGQMFGFIIKPGMSKKIKASGIG